MNNDLIETTKKLLFDQAKSAMTSFDLAQDSLDKAYLTIIFGNIAFYATKIKPLVTNIYPDIFSIVYMVICLGLILASFMVSKSAMRLFHEITVTQIEIFDLDPSGDLLEGDRIKSMLQYKLSKLDIYNSIIEQLNWQIPLMVVFSSSFCFIKVAIVGGIELKIILLLLLFWAVVAIIIVCIYNIRKNHNGKKNR